jgi:hypothetical protein
VPGPLKLTIVLVLRLKVQVLGVASYTEQAPMNPMSLCSLWQSITHRLMVCQSGRADLPLKLYGQPNRVDNHIFFSNPTNLKTAVTHVGIETGWCAGVHDRSAASDYIFSSLLGS